MHDLITWLLSQLTFILSSWRTCSLKATSACAFKALRVCSLGLPQLGEKANVQPLGLEKVSDVQSDGTLPHRLPIRGQCLTYFNCTS